MDNQSIHPEHTLLTAQSLFNSLTGLKISDEDFEDFAHLGLSKIGHNSSSCKLKLEVSEDGEVELPCDADTIISVSTSENDFEGWKAYSFRDGRIFIDDMGMTKVDHSSTGGFKGEYIDFKLTPPNLLEVDPRLEGSKIYILANLKLADKDGNYLINYKQVEAIVWYVAYLLQQRNAFIGKQGIDLGYIRAKALNAIADARVDEYVSDNQWNQLLDVKTSFGRKSYNKDFKFE